MRDLADVTVRTPGNHRRFLVAGKGRANIVLIFKEGKCECPRNSRLVSLTQVRRKVIDQILLEAVFKHKSSKKAFVTSQCWIYQGQIVSVQSCCLSW